MKAFSRLFLVAFLILFAIGMAGCNLFSGEKVPDSTENPIDETELLNNTGFEALGEDGVPVSWIVRGVSGAEKYPFGDGVVVSTEEAHSGSHSIRMELKEDEVGNYYVSQGVDVEGGKQYKLSVWVKSSLGAGGSTAFKFEFRDKDGDPIGKAEGGELSESWTTSFEDWENLTMTITTPERATRTSLLLRLYTPGVVYYDDVSLKRID